MIAAWQRARRMNWKEQVLSSRWLKSFHMFIHPFRCNIYTHLTHGFQRTTSFHPYLNGTLHTSFANSISCFVMFWIGFRHMHCPFSWSLPLSLILNSSFFFPMNWGNGLNVDLMSKRGCQTSNPQENGNITYWTTIMDDWTTLEKEVNAGKVMKSSISVVWFFCLSLRFIWFISWPTSLIW